MAEQIEMLFGFLIRMGWMKRRRCCLMSNYFDHLLFIIRPHRSTVYLDAAHCYLPSIAWSCLSVCWSVSLSVCRSVTVVSPAKTAEPIKMPFRIMSCVDKGNHILDGVQMLPREGALLGECMAHCKAYDVGGWIKGWAAQKMVGPICTSYDVFLRKEVPLGSQ